MMYECPCCGRNFNEEEHLCHLPESIWDVYNMAKLLSEPSTNLSFSSAYHFYEKSGLNNEAEIHDYVRSAQYSIETGEWIKNACKKARNTSSKDEFLRDLFELCYKKSKRSSDGSPDPSLIAAHLIYLDQIGLIPGSPTKKDYCEYVSDALDEYIEIGSSPWLLIERVDRSKVVTVTKRFDKKHLDINVVPNHSYLEYRDLTGFSFGNNTVYNSRGHNLIVKKAKKDLSARSDIDCVVSPHIFAIPPRNSGDDNSGLEMIGIDFASFTMEQLGPQMNYSALNVEVGS